MRRHQQTTHALGSTAYITLVADADTALEPIFGDLWGAVAVFEQRFSRFLPASELSQFNHAAGRKQPASPEFRGLLGTARDMAQKTGGLYNPFILPALQRAGYKGSWPRPDDADERTNYEQLASASWEAIEIGDDWAAIPQGTALDFGGIGKGYLLDELAGLLQARGIANYWLSLGGDILCAGLDEPGTPWQVGIQHAVQDSTVATVTNSGRKLAIATSGTTKRRGVNAGKAWHHIIDPRTSQPAETEILTATVCGDSATEADVYAKCLVVCGSASARDFMKTTGQKNALLQLGGDAKKAAIIQKVGDIWLA